MVLKLSLRRQCLQSSVHTHGQGLTNAVIWGTRAPHCCRCSFSKPAGAAAVLRANLRIVSGTEDRDDFQSEVCSMIRTWHQRSESHATRVAWNGTPSYIPDRVHFRNTELCLPRHRANRSTVPVSSWTHCGKLRAVRRTPQQNVEQPRGTGYGIPPDSLWDPYCPCRPDASRDSHIEPETVDGSDVGYDLKPNFSKSPTLSKSTKDHEPENTLLSRSHAIL